MKASLARILSSATLLVWSGAILYFFTTGRINSYLAPDFRTIALFGGLGLAVLGLFNIFTARRAAGCGHTHDVGDACGHSHAPDQNPLVGMVIMLVPLLLAIVWTKDQYSPEALARKGLYDTPESASFLASVLPPMTRETFLETHTTNSDGFSEVSLMEIFFSTGDREFQSILDGMKIETEGRWVEEKNNNPNGSRKRLYRLFITCCAADSRAIPIVLEFGAAPPEYPENSWVKVSGTLHFPTENGLVQPVLDVENVLAAEAPPEDSFMRF